MYQKLSDYINKRVRMAATPGSCESWYTHIEYTITVLFEMDSITEEEMDDLTGELIVALTLRLRELKGAQS